MRKDDRHLDPPLGDNESLDDKKRSMSRVISQVTMQQGAAYEQKIIQDNMVRVQSRARSFLNIAKMDDMDRKILENPGLEFAEQYVLTNQEQKGYLEHKPIGMVTEGNPELGNKEKFLDSNRKLVEEDKEKQTENKKANEYKGKEKEYGLGDHPYQEWDNPTILSHFKNNQETGFNDLEVTELRTRWGLNRITPKKTTPWIVKLILNMFGGFQIFLWIGGILCVIVYIITDYVDFQTLALGILCFLVVIGTSLFQTYQEGKSDDVMAALKALTPDQVKCFRNGKFVDIPAVQLVPGDIIRVEKGQKVPADLRVLKSNFLKVNNASLTGENVDINLNPDTKLGDSLYEAKNIARMGCNFTNGDGDCIVTSTGDNTFFGHIAKSTLNIKRPDSCLTKEIKRLVHIMGAIAITIGVIFLILALVRGYKAIEAVVFMIGIIVANVPEGLLPQMTVALTLTAKKMQSKGVVVTNLEIIETLGAVSVICSDKTGTLTCNRMTVSHLSYDLDIFGMGNQEKGEKVNENNNHISINIKDNQAVLKMEIEKKIDSNNSSYQKLFEIMIVNSNAKFDKEDQDKHVYDRSIAGGDASEAALIKFAQPLKDIQTYRSKFNNIYEIPFNSNTKWMLKICQSADNPNMNNGRYTYYLKGAPEKVLSFCKFYLHKGEVKPLERDFKVIDILRLNERLAVEGERVLAFAYKIANRDYPPDFFKGNTNRDKDIDFYDFVYTGLVSLQDPPRPGVKDSITKCNEAGIRVFMVTGDQPLTALSIARQLGLVSSENNGTNLLKVVREEIEAREKVRNRQNNNFEINPNDIKVEAKLGVENTESHKLYASKPDVTNEPSEFELLYQEKIQKFGFIQTKGRKNETLINGFMVVNGVELFGYTEEDWDRTFSYKDIVFARTMPQQKQDIVNQLKRKDEIIAMTGDGVNDAPALKAAHVGIAMGSGASVAKEAGQLILLNDDFSNIVDGIGEGRLIFENLKKCICYVLASNIPELIPFLLFIIIKIPLSIETIMIILIDVGTDLAPAISLAWEMEENETMKMPPRSMEDHLVGFKLMFVAYLMIGIIQTFASYFAWAWVYYDHGFTISDLIGAGIGYRDTWEKMTDEQRVFFFDMCKNSSWYQTNKVKALGKNCQQDFKDFMIDLLAISQSAFLMTVVWAQLICIFVRKTNSESIMSWRRIFCNIPLFWSLLIEIAVIIIVIYIPGLNKALLLTSVPPLYASTALWVIPFILFWEEVRKWLIRRSPNGCVSNWTKF